MYNHSQAVSTTRCSKTFSGMHIKGVLGTAGIEKKRPGVDFFVKEILAGLTNLHNQEHI